MKLYKRISITARRESVFAFLGKYDELLLSESSRTDDNLPNALADKMREQLLEVLKTTDRKKYVNQVRERREEELEELAGDWQIEQEAYIYREHLYNIPSKYFISYTLGLKPR